MKWTKKLLQKSFTRKLYDKNYEKQVPKSFFPNFTYTENNWQNAVEEIKKKYAVEITLVPS